MTLKVVNLPGRMTIDQCRKSGIDLDHLPWEPAERKPDQLIVRLALRYGEPCATGLIIMPADTADPVSPTEIKAGHEKVMRVIEESDVRAAVIWEQLFPGWTGYGPKNSAEQDENIEHSLERRQAELDEKLKEPPDQRLIGHWENLGGRLPSPL